MEAHIIWKLTARLPTGVLVDSASDLEKIIELIGLELRCGPSSDRGGAYSTDHRVSTTPWSEFLNFRAEGMEEFFETVQIISMRASRSASSKKVVDEFVSQNLERDRPASRLCCLQRPGEAPTTVSKTSRFWCASWSRFSFLNNGLSHASQSQHQGVSVDDVACTR